MKRDQGIQEQIAKFLNTDAESVTIPKDIMNDFLKHLNKTVNDVDDFLNKPHREIVLNFIIENIDLFAPDLFEIMSSHLINGEKLEQELDKKYNKEEILCKCCNILAKLNRVTNFYMGHQFLLQDTNRTNRIYEKDLQEYLKEHIEVVEEGMTLIGCNIPYINSENKKSSSIDILAKDKNGGVCVIELKVTNKDERLVFQCSAYPDNYEGCRMITIAPGYHPTILAEINKLQYVEKLIYKIDGNDFSTLEIKRFK